MYSISFIVLLIIFASLQSIILAKNKRPIAKYSANVDLEHFNESFPALHEEWCSYLHKYPEPSLIIYPRMPKCGSSTIDALFKELAKRGQFTFVHTPRELWTNYDMDEQYRKQFIASVRTNMHSYFSFKHKPVIVEGHFEKVIFDEETFDGPYESIQLMRDCPGRIKSMFFYQLFQCSDASRAIKEGRFKEYQMKKLNFRNGSKNFDFDRCFNDAACVRGFPFNEYPWHAVQHVCGSTCAYETGDEVKGAIYNAVHPEHFAAFGTLNRLEEFLEQLECVYPTLLKDISKTYKKLQVHENSALKPRNATKAFNQVIAESCDVRTTSMGKIYHYLEPFFKSRYQFMKENKGRCCRKRQKH
jgi:hypothetical protein